MARAILLVMDSLGVGETPDADKFGDQGANTLGNIAKWCAEQNSCTERDNGSLRIPNLSKLGLVKANELGSGMITAGVHNEPLNNSIYAVCQELSTGKDTPSGHWEMAGVPVEFEWGYFDHTIPCFPVELTEALKIKTNIEGVLGNRHGSGTEILSELGEKHIKTGYPIIYTSADSVIQIAAHEETFGLERLYQVCEVARELVDQYKIGRVIARPFVGGSVAGNAKDNKSETMGKGVFKRTGNRKDYTSPPHHRTLLDDLVSAGREVHSIGKIADIFAHRGLTHKTKATGHDALFDETLNTLTFAKEGCLIFTNFVEFDQSFGHRRNIGGYAAALEHFDNRLPEIIKQMDEGDLLVLTADHGCDPTFPGTDHTREHVPFIAYSHSIKDGFNAGIRESFCDIGQTIATHLDIKPIMNGTCIFSERR